MTVWFQHTSKGQINQSFTCMGAHGHRPLPKYGDYSLIREIPAQEREKSIGKKPWREINSKKNCNWILLDRATLAKLAHFELENVFRLAADRKKTLDWFSSRLRPRVSSGQNVSAPGLECSKYMHRDWAIYIAKDAGKSEQELARVLLWQRVFLMEENKHETRWNVLGSSWRVVYIVNGSRNVQY